MAAFEQATVGMLVANTRGSAYPSIHLTLQRSPPACGDALSSAAATTAISRLLAAAAVHRRQRVPAVPLRAVPAQNGGVDFFGIWRRLVIAQRCSHVYAAGGGMPRPDWQSVCRAGAAAVPDSGTWRLLQWQQRGCGAVAAADGAWRCGRGVPRG